MIICVYVVYSVYTTYDTTIETPRMMFRNQLDAIEYAKKEVANYFIKQGLAVIDGDKSYLIDQELELDDINKKQRESLRESALSKLTLEERKSLNL